MEKSLPTGGNSVDFFFVEMSNSQWTAEYFILRIFVFPQYFELYTFDSILSGYVVKILLRENWDWRAAWYLFRGRGTYKLFLIEAIISVLFFVFFLLFHLSCLLSPTNGWYAWAWNSLTRVFLRFKAQHFYRPNKQSTTF